MRDPRKSTNGFTNVHFILYKDCMELCNSYIDSNINGGDFIGDDIFYKVSYANSMEYAYAKRIKGKYYFHREDGPAMYHEFNGKRVCYFFLSGRGCLIEDLPCDPTLRLVLKLKYGDAGALGQYEGVLSLHGG